MAMRKLFWNNSVLIDAEDTGKNFNRTVRLDLGTGKVFIKRAGGPMEEL
jgi:chemotaxis protein CheD